MFEIADRTSGDACALQEPDISAAHAQSAHNESPPDENEKRPRSITAKDLAILLFGVYLPIAVMAVLCWMHGAAVSGLFLRHPVESIIEYGLALSIPLANYLAWRRATGEPCRHPVRVTVMNGMATGTALMIMIGAAVALYLDYPLVDPTGMKHIGAFLAVSATALCSLIVSVSLGLDLKRLWATNSARATTSKQTALGIIMSLLAVAGSEALPTFMRVNEHLANSDSQASRAQGLAALQALNCERELRMDCAAPMTVGLPGLFLHLDPDAQKRTYFAVTGKPFHNVNDTESDMATLTDSYLGMHVVGDQIPGLSMVRSAMTGKLDTESLTANIDWTFVFKNKNFTDQESRAELALPPGAVVSNLTLWINGTPHIASFGVNDKVQGAYRWVVVKHRDPALVTDLGRDRVLVQCYPVPAHSEMKVKVSITAPMKLNSLSDSSFTLPKLAHENFSITDSANTIRLKSTNPISTRANLRRVHLAANDELFVGKLTDKEVSSEPLSLTVPRSNKIGPFAAVDKRAAAGHEGYVVETIKQADFTRPSHLVVVLDGSVCMKEHFDQIKGALCELSHSQIGDQQLLIANGDAEKDAVDLKEGLANLKAESFAGGRDNLQALVRGAEMAGESPNGALVWLHGPQPSFNSEMYLMEPFVAQPRFYELAVDDDNWTDLREFFKNHKEIGPFVTIPRSGSITQDMGRLVKNWNGGKKYAIQLAHVSKRPACEMLSGASADNLAALWANERVKQLSDAERINDAGELASRYKLVTPLTACVVLEKPEDYQYNGLSVPEERRSRAADSQVAMIPASTMNGQRSEPAAQTANADRSQVTNIEFVSQAPALQSATNGTIAAVDDEAATYVTGVNTAGTVRVNNLANLEALLNIITNGMEILGLVGGGIYVCTSLYGIVSANGNGSGVAAQDGLTRRLVLGICMLTIGLAAPGFVNWMVASARDANLFS